MAEVTRVPLQPIAKGSLTTLWLGIIVAVLLAGALAWITAHPPSVSVETITAGEGASPQESDAVFIDYVGRLEDGTVFDQSQPTPPPPAAIAHLIPEGTYMDLAGVVPGFREGIMQMQRGGSYVIEIPAEKAYGSTPPPGSPIPADADLVFDVTLHDFMTPEELEQRISDINMIMMQAQMQAEAEGADAE